MIFEGLGFKLQEADIAIELATEVSPDDHRNLPWDNGTGSKLEYKPLIQGVPCPASTGGELPFQRTRERRATRDVGARNGGLATGKFSLLQ